MVRKRKIIVYITTSADDEFVVNVIPTFIGEGIPLIGPGRRTVPLRLLACTKFTDGVVKLHYAVGK